MSKLFLSILLLSFSIGFSQNVNKSKYPHVEQDLISTSPLWLTANLPITIDGVWAISMSAQYLKPNYFYGNAEVGYGFVAAKKSEIDGIRNPSARMLVDAEFGFAFDIFQRGSKSKYVTSQVSHGKTMTEQFYKIRTPTHYFLTPIVGFSLDPYPVKVINRGNKYALLGYNAVLPSYKIGVKLISASRSNVRIVDSKSGKVTEGSTARLGGIYFGYSFPLKKEIELAPELSTIESIGKPSWELYFTIPSFHNAAANFSFGLKSVQYVKQNNLSVVQGQDKASFQFFIGAQMYIN